MAPQPSTFDRVARWLREARHAVVFTGAGMSTESGIPDFRSPGGVWSQEHSRCITTSFWLRPRPGTSTGGKNRSWPPTISSAAEPNAGHQAIAQLGTGRAGSAVITQNIDGLHQQAGSRRVLELHGTARWIACVDCHAALRADAADPRVSPSRRRARLPCVRRPAEERHDFVRPVTAGRRA